MTTVAVNGREKDHLRRRVKSGDSEVEALPVKYGSTHRVIAPRADNKPVID